MNDYNNRMDNIFYYTHNNRHNSIYSNYHIYDSDFGNSGDIYSLYGVDSLCDDFYMNISFVSPN